MESGRCPHCHRDGPAGEPCASPGCALRRYHYVPASFVPELSKLGGDDDDPLLGRVVADFLVVGVVGSGGFGNVHHVLQLPLRARPVQGALKRLKLGLEHQGVDPKKAQGVLAQEAAHYQSLLDALSKCEVSLDSVCAFVINR